MSLQFHKICLVGLSVEFKKSEVLNYLTLLYPNSEFSLDMKFRGNGKNQGWATLGVKDQKLHQEILETGRFSYRGKNFFAKRYLEPEELKKFQEDFNQRRVFVKNIPRRVNNKQLASFFRVYGELEDAFIIQNSNKKIGLNYGFLVFRCIQDAQRLLKFNRIDFFGKFILIEKFRSRKKRKEKKIEKKYKAKNSKFDRKKNTKNKKKITDGGKRKTTHYATDFNISSQGEGNLGKSRNNELQLLLQKEQRGVLNHYEEHDLGRIRMGCMTYKQLCSVNNVPIITPYLINRGDFGKNQENSLASKVENLQFIRRRFSFERAKYQNPEIRPLLDFSPEGESSLSKAVKVSKLLFGHKKSNLRFRCSTEDKNKPFSDLRMRSKVNDKFVYGW